MPATFTPLLQLVRLHKAFLEMRIQNFMATYQLETSFSQFARKFCALAWDGFCPFYKSDLIKANYL